MGNREGIFEGACEGLGVKKHALSERHWGFDPRPSVDALVYGPEWTWDLPRGTDSVVAANGAVRVERFELAIVLEAVLELQDLDRKP